jgi:hypothetical protein
MGGKLRGLGTSEYTTGGKREQICRFQLGIEHQSPLNSPGARSQSNQHLEQIAFRVPVSNTANRVIDFERVLGCSRAHVDETEGNLHIIMRNQVRRQESGHTILQDK